ncbi:MAG TPA: BON domain-containing protein [Polyangia bacterium]
MSDRNEMEARPFHSSRSRAWGAALRIVDAGPISALAFLSGIVAGLFFGSPLPVGLAMAAALVAVAARLSSPRVWRLADEDEATKKVDLPPDTTIGDPSAKAQLARIAAARRQLDEVLSAGATDRPKVLMKLRAVRSLERAAVATLLRMDFYAHAPSNDDREGPSLEERDVAVVPGAPEMLERAAEARAERREALDTLKTHRLQHLARLEYLTSCLEAIPAELMELQSLERDMIERCRPDPVREADQFRDEVRQVRRQMALLLANEVEAFDRDGENDELPASRMERKDRGDVMNNTLVSGIFAAGVVFMGLGVAPARADEQSPGAAKAAQDSNGAWNRARAAAGGAADSAGKAAESASSSAGKAAKTAGNAAAKAGDTVGNTAEHAGAAASGTARRAGSTGQDARLASEIKGRIAAEMAPATEREVGVDTHEGVVTLSGTVDSEATRKRVVDLTRETKGVKSVKDDLSVRAKKND